MTSLLTGHDGAREADTGERDGGAAGKRTLSQSLPIQRRAASVAPPGDVATSAPPVTGDDPFGFHLDRGPAPIQAAGDANPFAAPPEAASGGGAPLPGDVRGKMEQSFGADFSSVRVHEGPQAESIGARAYTQGSDVHFAPGQYDPHGAAGQELLGHELTHVVQQSQGRVAAPGQAKGGVINSDPALEHEADVLGARAARGEPVGGVSSADGGVQCQFDDDKGLSETQRKNLTGDSNKSLRDKLAAVFDLGFSLQGRSGRIVYNMVGTWEDAFSAASSKLGMALGKPKFDKNPLQPDTVNRLYNEQVDGVPVTLRDWSSQSGVSGVIEVRFGGEVLEFKWLGKTRYELEQDKKPKTEPKKDSTDTGGGTGGGGD